MVESVSVLVALATAVTLGPGALAPADPGCLEAVEMNRITNGWGLARLGASCDDERNRRTVGGEAGPITADGSQLAVWVVPTNEELMIARDTAEWV